ncbi:MAG: hypothetical protein JW709_07030 [Sedimentisphaerales bacterium]|nr:hypothetical protein [Sedimentisphaerales bacterium]
MDTDFNPNHFIQYFQKLSVEQSDNSQWRFCLEMAESWLAYCQKTDLSQTDINSFIQRVDASPYSGSGLLDMMLQFKGWAKKKGFKVDL